jgi:hypothetical protein
VNEVIPPAELKAEEPEYQLPPRKTAPRTTKTFQSSQENPLVGGDEVAGSRWPCAGLSPREVADVASWPAVAQQVERVSVRSTSRTYQSSVFATDAPASSAAERAKSPTRAVSKTYQTSEAWHKHDK